MAYAISWPKVSIITPSFNQAEFLEETILSVLGQDYHHLEYIVIDGGSNDGSVDIIRRYEDRLAYWVSEPDGGQTDAINKGCRLATGDIIAYVNSDDSYCSSAISKVVDYFLKHPDIDLVYGDALHIDRKGALVSIVRTGEVDLVRYLSNTFYLPQPAVFFRRRVLDGIGYFDPHYDLAMDKEFWTRSLLHFKAGYLPEILAKLRIYTEAKSSHLKYKYLEEHLMILNWVFSNLHLLQNCEGMPVDIAQLRHTIYGSIYFTGGLEYLKIRQIKLACSNILRGLHLNPKQIFELSLYWSLFTALFGYGISHRIQSILRSYRNSKDSAFAQLNREYARVYR